MKVMFIAVYVCLFTIGCNCDQRVPLTQTLRDKDRIISLTETLNQTQQQLDQQKKQNVYLQKENEGLNDHIRSLKIEMQQLNWTIEGDIQHRVGMDRIIKQLEERCAFLYKSKCCPECGKKI